MVKGEKAVAVTVHPPRDAITEDLILSDPITDLRLIGSQFHRVYFEGGECQPIVTCVLDHFNQHTSRYIFEMTWNGSKPDMLQDARVFGSYLFDWFYQLGIWRKIPTHSVNISLESWLL